MDCFPDPGGNDCLRGVASQSGSNGILEPEVSISDSEDTSSCSIGSNSPGVTSDSEEPYQSIIQSKQHPSLEKNLVTKELRPTDLRPKMKYLCQFYGEECPYMLKRDGGRFRNYAELKYTMHSVKCPTPLKHLLNSVWLLEKILFAIYVHYNVVDVEGDLESLMP